MYIFNRRLKRPKTIAATVSVLSLVAAISVFQLTSKVGATWSNITGTVRNPSNGFVNGAYVYATVPSGSTPLYGPVTTNSSGAYTLNIPVSGTYDIHIDPPSNTGMSSYTDSSVSVSSDQTINDTLSAQTHTISGPLTDSSSNPLNGATVEIFKNSGWGLSWYQTTTNSTCNYSITAPAGSYYLYLSGNNQISGIANFTLSQSNTPSLNLLIGNLSLNLTIQTATMTITQYSNSGGTDLQGVTARATSGITSLYAGDPGSTISLVNSTGFTGTASGTIKTIVGATYAASGLESSSYTTSVCKGIYGGGSHYDCLELPLTVTGDTSFGVPAASPATRTFSGTLTDGGGSPIVGATVTLIKYSDQTTYATTDSSGNFTINAMPKKYYLKVEGGAGGITDFTLTQSSTNPTIDLTSVSVTQNLQVPTATLTVSADDGSGNPAPTGTTVNEQTSSGTATLYTGDPGETISIPNKYFTTSSGSNVGTLGTIVGAVYSAKGLNATNENGSLCDNTAASGHFNCLTTALTVTGSASINVPF